MNAKITIIKMGIHVSHFYVQYKMLHYILRKMETVPINAHMVRYVEKMTDHVSLINAHIFKDLMSSEYALLVLNFRELKTMVQSVDQIFALINNIY